MPVEFRNELDPYLVQIRCLAVCHHACWDHANRRLRLVPLDETDPSKKLAPTYIYIGHYMKMVVKHLDGDRDGLRAWKSMLVNIVDSAIRTMAARQADPNPSDLED